MYKSLGHCVVSGVVMQAYVCLYLSIYLLCTHRHVYLRVGFHPIGPDSYVIFAILVEPCSEMVRGEA